MPPRRDDWYFISGRSNVAWLGGGKLHAYSTTVAAEPLCMRSVPVPIALAEQRELTLTVKGLAPVLQLRVLDTAGRELGCALLALNRPGMIKRQLKVTGSERRAAVIEISHASCVFDFTLDLGRPRKPAPALLLRNLPLPPPRRWEVCMPAARVSWVGTKQSIDWSGNEFLYLVKCYSLPCLPNTALRYRARLSTRSGTVGIGVLDETLQTWVATLAYPAGEHIADICFESGRNRRFQIVVYSIGSEPLSTVIDWSEAMRPDAEPVPDDNPETTETCERPADSLPAAQLIALAQQTSGTERRVVRVVEPRGESGAESDAGPPTDDLANSSVSRGVGPRSSRAIAIAAERPSVVTVPGFGPIPAQAGDRVPERDLPPTARQRLHRFLMGPTRYYCQKPWTDLNNFTVDGRMDVCCIATGPSQERYQLGNLFNQTFQEVWNGPTAREFRRTVNYRDKALPPCVRCPMAYAYQGRYFSSDVGFHAIWSRLRLRRLERMPGGKRLHFALFLVLYGPIHILLYRGFRRERLLPPRWKIWSWYN
jgi:radical SAM protein with 4Fe4S-binding SPASM domain